MVSSNLSYEESRRKRVEENKKRMEALKLPRLAQAIRKPTRIPKPSPVKRRSVRNEQVVVRRSNRVANLPIPVYTEIRIHRVRIPRSITRRRDFANRVYATDEARQEALNKAEKLQSNLNPGYPTFIKSMLQSHVSGGFWLGLPVLFCKQNLPKRDEEVTLVDEDGNEYPTVYLIRKTGLSGGWRGFAVAHDLADGDALIFQLISRTTFKVYIFRAN